MPPSHRLYESPPIERRKIANTYACSSATFDLLRCFGWGGLLNLGWFTWPAPLGLLNLALSRGVVSPRAFLQRAQERLLDRSLRLLDAQPGEFVLDIACGRGRSTFSISHRVPRCVALGIDIDTASLRIARGLHGSPKPPRRTRLPAQHFACADALQLPLADASVDRILALECAFHFMDRRRFLAECFRVLRPGGRIAVIDFAWKNLAARQAAASEPIAIVRDIWSWTDFSTRDEYESMLQSSGFTAIEIRDWSSHVTKPLASIFGTIVAMARNRIGRPILLQLNPLLEGFDDSAWTDLAESARAHASASSLSSYLGMSAVRRSDAEP